MFFYRTSAAIRIYNLSMITCSETRNLLGVKSLVFWLGLLLLSGCTFFNRVLIIDDHVNFSEVQKNRALYEKCKCLDTLGIPNSYLVKVSLFSNTTGRQLFLPFTLNYYDSAFTSLSGKTKYTSFATEGDSIFISRASRASSSYSKKSVPYPMYYVNQVSSYIRKSALDVLFIDTISDFYLRALSPHDKSTLTYEWDADCDNLVVTDVMKSEKYYINDSFIYRLSRSREGSLDSTPARYLKNSKDYIKENVNCKDLLPLKQIETPNNTENSNLVLIYSYLGCAPCMLLKNKLTELVSEGKLDSNKVKIVNFMDTQEAIQKYKKAKSVPFEYLDLVEGCKNGGFPIIAAYDKKGRLLWSEVGYTKKVIYRIRLTLKD